MIVSMPPAGVGLFEHTVLWMYAVCYVLIWIYLPVVEKCEEEPPLLRWSSVVVHVVGAVAMIVYLTGAAVVTRSYPWWALLGTFVVMVVIEDLLAYRRMMRKPDPRGSRNQNRIACLFGAVGHSVLRIPCGVVIYRLAERA